MEATVSRTSAAASRPRVLRLRSMIGLLHRWIGLATAAFLFVAGITGALIAWAQELDGWLNPQLMYVQPRAERARSALELAREVEARHPEAQVTFLPLAAPAGRSLSFGVEPRVDPATGQARELAFNEVFVDPGTGVELGTRRWGASWPITRASLVSFVYELHYSLHLPALGGVDRWGVWLMGSVALLWAIDCFFGLYLTLPARAQGSSPRGKSWLTRWRPSWRVRWGAGSYKLNFDLHRAGGLWIWGVLLVIAFTGFSMNLYKEAFLPLVSSLSQVTPTPYEQRQAASQPVAAAHTFADVLSRARAHAARQGWQEPAGSVSYARELGFYAVSFHFPDATDGESGLGPRQLYYDALDGKLLGTSQPTQGSLADVYVNAQLPLHSGRLFGLPGRILVSLAGVLVALLSVTGVVVWWRKRRARVLAQARDHVAAPLSERPREAFSS